MTEAEVLTEAYHTLYDIKDGSTDTTVGGLRYQAYLAIQAIKVVMMNLGMAKRYDGDGRTNG